jgi:predicted metal-binding membrane protein
VLLVLDGLLFFGGIMNLFWIAGLAAFAAQCPRLA